MATTSLSLGKHWESFIKQEVSSGRYGSVSEVIRDALRQLEEKKGKLGLLRAHLAEGATQAENGQFATNYSIKNLMGDLDKEE